MSTVVINHDLPIDEELDNRCTDLTTVFANSSEEVMSALPTADIFVCSPTYWDDQFLDGLDPGDWIQTTSAGYDALPVDDLRNRGITLTNATGIHNPVVAEHVFSLAFSFSRMIPRFVSNQTDHSWGSRTNLSMELTDWKERTLTVYGLGSIGEAIAKRGSAFEMDVYGIKRTPNDYQGCLSDERVLSNDEFFDILPETDLLVAIVPLTDETRNSIDSHVFQALPESAILINVARGPVVDEEALISALRSEEIAGAGLDVFNVEPLPEESPLWTRDDVIITPHVGGRSETFPKRFADLFLKNYERWQQNNKLINRIV